MQFKNISIAIVGPGAIGVYIAFKFEKYSYNTSLIYKKKNINEVLDNRFCIKYNDNPKYFFKPKISTQINHKIDYLFICTKYYHLDEVISTINIEHIKDGIVIPLLNGFMHYNKLRKIFFNNLVAGTIGGVVAVKENNIIDVKTSKPKILMSSNNAQLSSKIENLNNILNIIGMPSEVLKNENEVVWHKLSRLSIISALTTATQHPLGYAKSDPTWNTIMHDLINEMIPILKSQKINIKEQDLLNSILSLPDNLTTSLQKDIIGGKQSELDQIIGSVIDMGEKYNCKVKEFKNIYTLINEQIKN